MAKLRTVRLTLLVTYGCDLTEGTVEHVPDEAVCRDLLERVVEDAASDGKLSGDSPYLISDYEYKVDSVGVNY